MRPTTTAEREIVELRFQKRREWLAGQHKPEPASGWLGIVLLATAIVVAAAWLAG